MMFFKQKPIAAAVSESVNVEHDGLMEAIHESMCDYEYEIAGKLPVAMSNVYEMYICDTTKTEDQKLALMEGVMADAWEKIKAFFKKIAEKLKSWWNSAVKYFQTIFSSNKKFLEKFKDEITGKDTAKFKFTGYTYEGHAKLNDVEKTVQGWIGSAKSNFQALSNLDSTKYDEYKDKCKKAKADMDSAAMKFAKEGGDSKSGNVSKFKAGIIKTVRGGSEKKEIVGFKKGLSLNEMISMMESGGDKIDNLKELATSVSDAADEYADLVDIAKSKLDKSLSGTEKSHASSIISAAADVAKYSLSYGTAACDAAKSLTSEIISHSSSVCRSLARFTPAKESYGPQIGNKTSLLEAFSAGF